MTLLIVWVLRGMEIFADQPMIDKRDLTDIFNKDSWMHERHGRNSDDDQDCVKCYDESTHQWKAMHWVTRGISDDWHFSPSPPSPSCELQSFNHHSCVFIYLIRVFVCRITDQLNMCFRILFLLEVRDSVSFQELHLKYHWKPRGWRWWWSQGIFTWWVWCLTRSGGISYR